jgi:hypothetical protein
MAGQTTVQLDDHPLVKGQTTGLRIYQNGGRTIARLIVRLECSTKRVEGLDIENVRVKTLCSEEIVSLKNLSPVQGEPVWQGQLGIPAGLGAFTAVGKKWWRSWGLHLEMKINGRALIRETYTLQVDDARPDCS